MCGCGCMCAWVCVHNFMCACGCNVASGPPSGLLSHRKYSILNAGSPTVYSHFGDGASCPAYVIGRDICLRSGADCASAKNWEISNLVRALLAIRFWCMGLEAKLFWHSSGHRVLGVARKWTRQRVLSVHAVRVGALGLLHQGLWWCPHWLLLLGRCLPRLTPS